MRMVLVMVALAMAACGTSDDLRASVECVGDVRITSLAEYDAFKARGCEIMNGTLRIEGTGLASFDLPALVHLKALHITYNQALTTFCLPALRGVGLLSVFGNDALTGFSLPELVSAGLEVSRNAALTAITLPALRQARARISCAPSDPGCLAALTSISLPALTESYGLVVSGTDHLTGFDLPVLTFVQGPLEVSWNAALARFSLPALTTIWDSLDVSWNATLTSFEVPMLDMIGFDDGDGPLEIRNNPALPGCLALAFKDRLVAAHGYKGQWAIYGNDTAATCTP